MPFSHLSVDWKEELHLVFMKIITINQEFFLWFAECEIIQNDGINCLLGIQDFVGLYTDPEIPRGVVSDYNDIICFTGVNEKIVDPNGRYIKAIRSNKQHSMLEIYTMPCIEFTFSLVKQISRIDLFWNSEYITCITGSVLSISLIHIIFTYFMKIKSTFFYMFTKHHLFIPHQKRFCILPLCRC